MKKILISGYYGFNNSGDDALLSCIIEDIEKVTGTRSQIVVLSQSPDDTSRQYNVAAIDRMNIFSVIAALGRAGLLISGGGTLIQDGTSTKSLLYYLGVIMLARFFGVKTMLYANGIGPIKHEKNINRTKKVLKNVDLITLRDERSFEFLKKLGICDNVYVTADPVFNMERSNTEKGRKLLLSLGVPEGRRYFGISVRPAKDMTDDKLLEIARAADDISERYGLYPVILPMHAGRDEEISKRLTRLMKTETTVIKKHTSVSDMIDAVGCMSLVMGMRLHTLIYSAASAVPVIGLVYDPKVSGFMEYAGQTQFVDVADITYERIMSLADAIMSDYDTNKAMLRARCDMMRAKCEDNREHLSALLELSSEADCEE